MFRDDGGGRDEHEDGGGGGGAGGEGTPGPAAKAVPDAVHVERVVEALRRLGDNATIERIQDEVNAVDGERLALGQIDLALREALARGLVDRAGEQWSPVRPGVLAMRRGALLQRFAIFALSGGDWADEQRAFSAGLAGVDLADVQALVRAGVLKAPDNGADCFSVEKAEAENMVARGAIQVCAETIPECRVPAVTQIFLAPDASDDATRAAIAKVVEERDAALRTAEKAVKGRHADLASLEKLRDFVQSHGIDPSVIESPPPAPVTAAPLADPVGSRRETWTKEVVIDQAERARMLDESLALADRLSELRRQQTRHKELNAEVTAGFKKDINATIDAHERLGQELKAGKRTVDREAIVTIDWKADQEVWTDANTGEVLERRKIASGTQRALPVDPPKPKAGEAPFAAAEPPPGPGAAPPEMVAETVQGALIAVVGELKKNETLPIGEAADRVAKRGGWQAGALLLAMVKSVAQAAHKAGLVHWEAANGEEWVGPTRKKAKKTQAEQEAEVLAALADGPLSGAEIQGKTKIGKDTLDKVLKALIAAEKIEQTGKKYQLKAAEGSAS